MEKEITNFIEGFNTAKVTRFAKGHVYFTATDFAAENIREELRDHGINRMVTKLIGGEFKLPVKSAGHNDTSRWDALLKRKR